MTYTFTQNLQINAYLFSALICVIYGKELFQRPHRTRLLALLTKNALGGVLPLARVVVDLYLHRADFQALVAMDALRLVALDAQ